MKPLFLKSARLAGDCPDDYAFRLPAVRALENGVAFTAPVTFLCGENGTGKSTVLEALAVAAGCNPEGGGRNFRFSTAATHAGLHAHLRLTRGALRERDCFFLRAESFYNVATEIQRLDEQGGFSPPLINAYGGKSLHAQSHGESFLSLVLNRFGGQGLYFLDEPEAALSAARQLTLLAALHELCAQGSQFFIATHSPLLLAYPEAEIFVLDGRGLIPTRYEDTEPYRITKAFLDAPGRMLQELWEA